MTPESCRAMDVKQESAYAQSVSHHLDKGNHFAFCESAGEPKVNVHRSHGKKEMQEIMILQWNPFKIVADDTVDFPLHHNGYFTGVSVFITERRDSEKLSANMSSRH